MDGIIPIIGPDEAHQREPQQAFDVPIVGPGEVVAAPPSAIRQNLAITHGSSPEQFASDRKIGSDLGVTPMAVQTDRDWLKLRSDQIRFGKALEGYPGTAKAFESRDTMALFKDDLENLTSVERWIKHWTTDPVKELGKAALGFIPKMAEALNYQVALGLGEADAVARGIESVTGLESGGLFAQLRDRMLVDNRALRSQWLESDILGPTDDIKDKRLAENPELLLSPAYLIRNVGDAAPSYALAIIQSLMGAGPVAAGLAAGSTEAGGLYQDLIEQGVDQDKALYAANLYGPVSAALNAVGFEGWMGRDIARTALGRFVQRGVAGGVEGLTEYLEEPAQALFTSMALGEDWQTTWGNVVDSLANVDVIPGAFLLGGGATAIQQRTQMVAQDRVNTLTSTAKQLVAAMNADAEIGQLDVLRQAALSTKGRGLDPVAYEGVVAAQLGAVPGAPTEVQIDGVALAELVKQTDEALDTLARLGLDMEDVRTAAQAETFVTVPLEKYAAYAFGTPLDAGLTNDIKLTLDGMTLNEKAAFEKDVEAQNEAMRSTLEENAQFREDYGAIAADIAQKVSTLGRSPQVAEAAGQVWASFAATLAKRYGSTPMQIYNLISPQVRKAEDVVSEMSRQRQAAMGFVQIGADETINGITRQQAGEMMALGDEAIVEHIIQGVREHGSLRVQDAIRNEAMSVVSRTPAGPEREEVRRRIAALEPKINAAFEKAAREEGTQAPLSQSSIETAGAEQDPLGFFSPTAKAIEAMDFKAMPATDLMNRIRKAPGIKQEELDDLGLFDWLEGVDGKVSKDAVVQFIKDGGPKFEEVVLGEALPRLSALDFSMFQPASPEDIKQTLTALGKAPFRVVEKNGQFVVDQGTDAPTRYAEGFKDRENAESAAYWYSRGYLRAGRGGDQIIIPDLPNGFFVGKATAEDAARLADGVTNAGEWTLYLGGDRSESYTPLMTFPNETGTFAEAVAQGRSAIESIPGLEKFSGEWDASRSQLEPKYEQYVLPGSENYREVLLTLPQTQPLVLKDGMEIRQMSDGTWNIWDRDGWIYREGKPTRQDVESSAAQDEMLAPKEQADFRSPHWDEPNVLAHFRLNDRVDADGKRTLFVEEIQSDWHQAGRKKGYKGSVEDPKSLKVTGGGAEAEFYEISDENGNFVTNVTASDIAENTAEAALREAERRVREDRRRTVLSTRDQELVPNAPFKKSWPLLAFKRVLRMAAEQGYDAVAWTPGEVQFDRWGSQEIAWRREGDAWVVGYTEQSGGRAGDLDIEAEARRRGVLIESTGQTVTTRDQLEAIVRITLSREAGEYAADKWEAHVSTMTDKVWARMQDEPEGSTMPRKEGMAGFYDRILPTEIGKYVKKLDKAAKVGTAKLPVDNTEIAGTVYDWLPPYLERRGMTLDDFNAMNDAGKEALLDEAQAWAAQDMKEVWSLPITDAMREAVMAGQPLYQKRGDSPGRGLVTSWDIGVTRPIVGLFEAADTSTFLHESGHIFFEVMKQMAAQPDAPQSMKDDVAALDEYVGAKVGATWTREQHERLARTMEAYFMEGKAPSIKLVRVFQQFSTWLRDLYRSVMKLDVRMADDVRGVLDRMFATDQELAEVEDYYSARGDLDATALAMDEKDKADLERKRRNAEAQSRDSRLKRYIKAHLDNLGGKTGIEAQARRDVEARPEFAAIEQALADGGFHPDVVDAIIGEDARKELSKKRIGLVKKDGVVDPDAVARDNGYASAGQMLGAVLKTGKKSDAIKERAKQIEDKHTEMIVNGLNEENALDADADYHGDARLAVLVAEYNILRKKIDGGEKLRARTRGYRIEQAAIRDVARNAIDRKKARDAMAYYKFSQAEAKAARAFKKAMEAGDLEEAARQKRIEVINHAMVMESVALREEVDTGIRRLKKGIKSKKIEQEPLNILQDIHVRFGFVSLPTGISLKDFVAAREDYLADQPDMVPDYEAYEKRQQGLGYGVALSPEVMNRTISRDYRDLTAVQLRGVLDTVHQVAHIDKTSRQVKTINGVLSLDAVRERLIAQLEETFELKDQKYFEDERWSAVKKADAWLAKIEFLLKRIDGDKLGPWHEIIFQGLARAEEQEAVRSLAAQRALHALFVQHYSRSERGSMFSKRVRIPEVGESMTRAQMVRVALDMGNEDNLRKRMEGHGWTEEGGQVEAIKARLTKQDWDFVQGVWDFIDSFREESFGVERRMTGRVPQRVVPTEVRTRFGAYRGGYFPVVTDAKRSNRAQALKALDEAALFSGGGGGGHAMTKHGHLKERVQTTGGQALSTDLTDISRHVTQVIHDITHREAVVEVGKVLMDKEVSGALRQALGHEMASQFMPWLKDIANPQYEAVSSFEAFMRGVRIGTTVVKLAKFSVMLQQVAGFTQSVHFLGRESWRLPKAFVSLFGNPVAIGERMQTVFDKSDFMSTRLRNYSREAHDAFSGLDAYKALPRKVGEFAMQGIGVLQMMVDAPTWVAGYEVAVAEGKTEAQAVAEADSLVRISQSGGGIKDQARVQRGSEFLKLATMFYSFMNMAYNMFTSAVRGKHVSWDQLGSAIFWVGLVGPIAAELLSGRPPDDDDDETWAQWLAQVELRFYGGLLPVARDIVGAVGSGFGYQMSPVESSINTIIRGIRAIPDVIEEGEGYEKLAKPAAELVGLVYRLPTDQAFITASALWAWLSGDQNFEPQDIIYRRRD